MSTRGREAAADDGELERLRAEVRDLRARARVRPLISQAQGILQERYALPDAESAFALMQRASQRYNVKLRTLAGMLVTAPRPEAGDALWFPGRVRGPEPELTFTRAHRSGSGSRGAVLKAVLGSALTVVGTDMGNVQLTDRARGGLNIEEHTGLTAGFVDFFAHVGDDGTSCAQAARDVSQVTVREVESDPVFTEPARRAILAAGSRACHSVPLTTASGLCVGMVSAHLDRPLNGLTTAQTKALDTVGTEAGRWLAWHDRTVVLDALEHLHALGSAGRGRRLRRS
ncbi:ANTAR domain-containing protein [Streptomyces indiaensis]|uniref:GAF and ANTAR domain-containing protein n=1 Tax=Streptomyces indiaensis TaxID=284033 RepID=A0ABN3EG65_9ACTN|nr:ANTAR domain-containing protein [Streptomyces indiaensis]MCF1647632.1 ANTAR domain-containing protein [Streptomyces indiaensis]